MKPYNFLSFSIVFLLILGFQSQSQSASIAIPKKRPNLSENLLKRKKPDTSIGTASSAPFDGPKSSCEQQLDQLGAIYTRIPAITDENGCGIEHPISVTNITKEITLSPSSRLTCETALAVGQWTKNIVLPTARHLFPSKNITQIQHASTYACRTRKTSKGVKLSEHAKGLAIDIIKIRFSDQSVHVIKPMQRTGTKQEAFQKAIRFGACAYFTTVLGPFSDANHSDHLHLDNAKRRGDYRLCDLPLTDPAITNNPAK